MAFVNKTMLHLDHSDLRQMQEQTSWEALPEQARTLSLAAIFSLLHHFERASERGEKVFFPDMYTPVGVDLGFTMTQRFIAVDDTVLFREAVNKLITALINSDYLEVSLSQLHPGNLNYALSEAGRELLAASKDNQARDLAKILPLQAGVYLYYLQRFYPELLSHLTVRELLPIVLSVTPSYPAAAPVKIRELVLRECGFVQGWYGLSYLEQRIVEPAIARALSLLTGAGYLRTKTIHEYTDSPVTLYSLSPEAKELVALYPEQAVPAAELSSVLREVPEDDAASVTAEDILATEKLLVHMGTLLFGVLSDGGGDIELSLPSLEQVFERDERLKAAAENPFFQRIEAQDYLYDVLTAHRYLSERGTVYSLGPDFASALAQVQEPKIEHLVAAALLDPAAVDALPYPHQLLYPILKIVGKNPRISYYDVYDELKADLGIPYLQGEVAPHRYKLTPRLRNRFSVAMHVLKGERFLNALREGTGRTSRKNPERYELSESGRELLERFPEGAPEAVTARLALEVAAAQVREALKRYRAVFRREALAPALAGVSGERFRRIGFDLFLMRGYHVEPLDAQGVDGVATPASGDAEHAFYIRALRLDSGAVSPQEITRFFLAVHARGGQLGTFITNTAFSDEAYDEFIRCSTKYPQILVDLVSGNELQDRLIAHRLGVAEGTGGLLELKGEYFTS